MEIMMDNEHTSSTSGTSSSASANESTRSRINDPICQNCMAYTKEDSAGWCRTKEKNVPRKFECEYFRLKKRKK